MTIDPLAIQAFALDRQFALLGVPATVTPVNGAPIATRGIWVHLETVDAPLGGEISRRVAHRCLSLPMKDLPGVPPTRSQVQAPEVVNGPVLLWRVDGFLEVKADLVRVLLVKDL